MKIELREIAIRDLITGYADQLEEGVTGYFSKLNIRPAYQREFIYKEKQRNAVIETVFKGFPLNVMYWAVVENDHFELIDGQQRSLSICQYVEGNFSISDLYFHNLKEDEQNTFLDYKLMVYFCSGTESETLDWFKTINIAGEALTDQELRNAVYSGPWVTDAKRYFSKTNCPAYQIASDLMSGSAIRQDYLETSISWITATSVEDYMGLHQQDLSAHELWLYFQKVVAWVRATFPNYRKEMKGVDWGYLFNQFEVQETNPNELEQRVSLLMMDEDVTAKKGIYPYVLSGREKYLNLRTFSDNQKREAFERQKGICKICKQEFEIEAMEADHITPWSQGGKTELLNCQMLCKDDNRRKSDN